MIGIPASRGNHRETSRNWAVARLFYNVVNEVTPQGIRSKFHVLISKNNLALFERAYVRCRHQ